MAGGATGVDEPAETTKPEIQPEPKPTVDPNTENIKVGTQIDRSGPAYGNENRGQCHGLPRVEFKRSLEKNLKWIGSTVSILKSS